MIYKCGSLLVSVMWVRKCLLNWYVNAVTLKIISDFDGLKISCSSLGNSFLIVWKSKEKIKEKDI